MAENYQFWLDGREVSVDAEPKAASLEVLRDQLGVFTAKAGCSPQGLCGCCTVLVEGKPRLTCTLPVKSLAGKKVESLAGLPAADQAVLAEAFAATGAAQCGYCTPGIVLSSWNLLQSNPAPSHEDQAKALNIHVCRCTGYSAIYAAIDRAAAARRGEQLSPPPTSRPDGEAIALGQRAFVDDLVRPGLLHGGVVLAPVARGVVEGLDLSAAAAMPGVVATQALVKIGDEVEHAGTVIAAIAAEDPQSAAKAAAAVVVQLGAIPGPTPSVTAIFRRRDGVENGKDAGGFAVARRDALAGSAAQVALSQTAAASDPVHLEPEAALAVPEGDGVVVYSAGHDGALDVGVNPARLVLVPSGGSYGGKDLLTVEPAAAALCRATGRPVRVGVTHTEGMRLHPKRAGGQASVELGADSNGRITLLDLSVSLDGGARPLASDVRVSQLAAAVPYAAPILAVEAQIVRSEAPFTGKIRGSAALVTVTLERAMDRLARELGLSAAALRRINLPEAAPLLDVLGGDGSLASVARADGERGARVVLTVTGPDEIEVSSNVPDLGQGRDARLLSTLTRHTGLSAEVFVFPWGRGEVLGSAAGAGAAVERAAADAAKQLCAVGGPLRGLIGRSFVAEDHRPGAPGLAAARAELNEVGALTRVVVAVACGAGQDPVLVKNLGEGALHMATGMALSEEVDAVAGLPEGRFRFLGVLKPKGCPIFEVHPVVLGEEPRDPSEVVLQAGVAAIVAAVERAEGKDQDHLPMKESAAAKALGVRPKPPGK